jgi:hypothetical protein
LGFASNFRFCMHFSLPLFSTFSWGPNSCHFWTFNFLKKAGSSKYWP